MLSRLRGTGRTSGATRERQPHRVPGRRVGVLADDEHPHVVQRLLEGAQHAVAGRQVPATGRDLGAQELAHRRDRVRDRLERRAHDGWTSSGRAAGGIPRNVNPFLRAVALRSFGRPRRGGWTPSAWLPTRLPRVAR